MARILRLVSSSLPAFIFASLAFAFTVITITSRDWAQQNHFDNALDMKNWSKPIYRTYRSPFQICTVSQDTASDNTTIYTEHCNVFDAYGFDKTSCETVFATQNYSAAQTGDERLCQQIHFAGNLAITSTTFISLGFVLTLLMTLACCASSPAAHSEHVNEDEPSATTVQHHRRRPTYAPYMNLILITSFAIGATAALLSQFYGILGFIQSQPDNGLFASARGNVIDPTQDDNHGPWIEGRALKIWVTCAWVFAAFAAGAAGAAWRLPRWEKSL
jgi:hypothetical protein